MESPLKRVLVLAHGWANTPEFFEPLLARLQSEQPGLMVQSQVLLLDQNYFAASPQDGPISDSEPCIRLPASTTGNCYALAELPALIEKFAGLPWVGVGHSLGFAHLLQWPVHWQKLVSLHGFTRFCSQTGHPQGTSPRVLQRMLNQFSHSPGDVLKSFWERCGKHPLPSQPSTLSERLLQHLQLMQTINLPNPPGAPLGPACLALWSENDPIVPAPLSQACFGESTEGHLFSAHDGPNLQPNLYTDSMIRFIQPSQEPSLP